MSLRRSWLPLCFFVLTLALASGYSRRGRADARSEARGHFEAGMQLIAQGRYETGIAELERADEIFPHPAVRYNIARALADAGHLDRAITVYRSYLRTEPDDRDAVEALLVDLKRRRAAQLATKSMSRGEPSAAGRTGEVGRTPHLYEERIVTASRRAQNPLDAPNSTTIVTAQDIRLSGITRIPELLRRVAGMDVMQITGGDSNVSMRGSNGRLANKLLILIDGRVIKNDILGSTFWEGLAIDVDQVERIEVVRGPGSSLYGADAFAGVVNIITRTPGEGGNRARVGVGDHAQLYASLSTTGRDGDLAYRAGAGFTRYPRWTREVSSARVDLRRSDFDQNVGAQNARAYLDVTRRFSKGKRLRVTSGYSHSLIDIYGVGPFNDYVVDMDHGYVDGRLDVDPLVFRLTYTHLSAFASANAAYLGHGLYETDPRQDVVGADVQFNRVFRLLAHFEHELSAGLGYRLKRVRWNYLVDEPPTENHVGVFAQDAVRVSKAVRVVLSGRVDYVPSIRTAVPSARGSVILRPSESGRQAVRASVGTAFRSPSFLESHLHLPIQLSLAGLEMLSSSSRDDDVDFRLGPENILAAELGYANQEHRAFQVETAAYYHRISDAIELADARPLTLSDVAAGLGGINPETGRFRVASGGWQNDCGVDHVFGGELGARWYGVEGIDVFANYAVNYKLLERPTGCAASADRSTSRHKVNAGVQLRSSFGLDAELSVHYQTAQRWVEQIASLEGIVDRRFDLPAYHLLNGSVGYSFLERRKARAEVVVFNALSGVVGPPPQMHPFGNRVGRRIMGFLSYRL